MAEETQNLTITLKKEEREAIDKLRHLFRQEGMKASRADVIRTALNRFYNSVKSENLDIENYISEKEEKR